MSKQRHVVLVGEEVLRPRKERTDERWGRAVRKALNELVRCREESRRQQQRIERVLLFAEEAFDQLKAAEANRKATELRVKGN